MKASSRLATLVLVPALGSVLALCSLAPAFAEDSCDLSFTGEPCATLPCPSGGYKELPCPFPGSQNPVAGAPPWVCHPYPQPQPAPSKQCSSCGADGCVTAVNTSEGVLPPSNPFDYRTYPGTNLLPTVYTNVFDSLGHEMPNTLPSTPGIPYNLHGDPVVTEIDPTSPIDDIFNISDDVAEKKVQEVVELHKARAKAAPGEWTDYDKGDLAYRENAIKADIQTVIDILEGNFVPYRAYSGFPLLHYDTPEKVKKVEVIRDNSGKIVGGNVDVHQIWYWQHIESDTAYIDPTPIMTDDDGNPIDVEWTITYTVDVLSTGHDDFSPFVMYMDYDPQSPSGPPSKPGIAMDQTFFDMQEGTRTVFKVKMTYPKYLNLIYTWGWRMHPPRVQVAENATKKVSFGAGSDDVCLATGYDGLTLPEIEEKVFGKPPMTHCAARAAEMRHQAELAGGDPAECEAKARQFQDDCRRNQLAAIAKIGDLAPEKRMWNALREAQKAADGGDFELARKLIRNQAKPAFLDWLNRTHLPCLENDLETGECIEELKPDPESDLTILYVNNTIYGQLTAGGWVRWPDWETRYWEWKAEHDAFEKELAEWTAAMQRWEEGPRTEPAPEKPREPAGPPILRVTAFNGDNFVHSYIIADFGGNRGWENQFKSSTKVGGSGCWFTFGRVYWAMPAGGSNGYLCVPEASGPSAPGKHKFEVQFNYEPSQRVRFYQFDPFHHDVAIYSIH